ncbi:MAG: peroxidase family protein [Chloroflexota bacterium]
MPDSSASRPGHAHAHGRVERGIEKTSRSRLFQGRFGRMFRSLPPADFDDEALVKLAVAMIAEDEGTTTEGLTPETKVDDEENYGLPAGYTYFGQFVDHDITFDPLSSLVKINDPDGLTNFRTPSLDLDGLYGRGPDDQPYMYDARGRKFILGRSLIGQRFNGKSVTTLAQDLPRNSLERAIIGDMRNDENVIISQLHGLFLRFHNHLAESEPDLAFEEIQKIVRWHYQWLVLFDYLPRIVGRDLVQQILPHVADPAKSIYDEPPKLHFYNYRNSPFMPVEFSGAAYRFGHSLVRPVYRLSAVDLDLPRSGEPTVPGLDGRKLVFAPRARDGLNGFRMFPSEWGIDWDLFFEAGNRRLTWTGNGLGKGRVQPAYKIDTSLVHPLSALPEFSASGSTAPRDGLNSNNLAYRNLKRGVSLQLPSGQAVARYMGLEPIPDCQLFVGKATVDSFDAGNPDSNKSIVQVDKRFAGKAPLWFYVLAESLHQWRDGVKLMDPNLPGADPNVRPTRLGPVGGRIVAEVIIGLLLGDNDLFLSMEPNWKPWFGNRDAWSVFDRFAMGDLIREIRPRA